VGLSEFQAKNIARQLCEAVAFLNSQGLTHTDLKTENIVLETKEASITDPDVKIKLIDLGCASWGGGAAGTVTQTCHYRAPEVLLGLEWHFPSDMWSVGCVLLELLESAITFDTLFLAQVHLRTSRMITCGPNNCYKV
jgi:serine/threonine protein kinase